MVNRMQISDGCDEHEDMIMEPVGMCFKCLQQLCCPMCLHIHEYLYEVERARAAQRAARGGGRGGGGGVNVVVESGSRSLTCPMSKGASYWGGCGGCAAPSHLAGMR